MRKVNRISLLVAVVLVFSFAGMTSAQEPLQIDFWHAMTGGNGEAVTALVADFNASQSEIVVVEQNKGNYDETLNAVIAASGQGEGPHITMIFDLGTPLAIDSGFFIPLESALTDEQFQQVQEDVLPPLLNYFTVNDTLWSLPWNNSTPLLYYNKDMFEAAGLDPEVPPATWQEIQDACAAIVAANAAPYCFSPKIYGWFFEQWMAIQGQELVNNGNGRADRATETNLTSDAARNIMQFWQDVNDEGYWIYTGRLNDTQGANQIFVSGQSAIMLESTGQLGSYTTGSQTTGFELGTGFFPSNAEIERQGVIIGGASLWLGSANTDEENQAAVEFLMWLHEPEQMARWHQATGYLPITLSSQELLTEQGYYEENPNALTAIEQLAAVQSTPATAGAITGPFPQIRTLIEQAIQSVVVGGDIDEALADLKEQADLAIEDYNSRLQ